MINLKLLSRIQNSDTMTLILRNIKVGTLEYYIVARSVTCDIVCAGTCDGEIEGDIVAFDIRMASLIPMIDKGVKFNIRYADNTLVFTTEDDKVHATPLYVEVNSSGFDTTIERYLRFNAILMDEDRHASIIESKDKDLLKLNARLNAINEELENGAKQVVEEKKLDALNLSGFVNDSNPWGTSNAVVIRENTMAEEELLKEKQQIEEEQKALREELEMLREEGVSEFKLDMHEFFKIANIAAANNEVVDMCGEYAIASIGGSFALQKAECPIMSIQGKLLQNLLRDGSGNGFYWFENGLVYQSGAKDKTIVFVNKCLPNNQIDSTIITRGVVEEKYSIKLDNVLTLIPLLKSNFPMFKIEMGAGRFVLENDMGESVIVKFSVEDAKTIQLNKLMRGEQVSGSINMADIVIPPELRTVLGNFKDSLTIYVKKNKVVFQNDKFYLVFGR